MEEMKVAVQPLTLKMHNFLCTIIRSTSGHKRQFGFRIKWFTCQTVEKSSAYSQTGWNYKQYRITGFWNTAKSYI